ncbi:MAG: hypothetical protein NT062_30855 [Proteobacteria bacterium]|nr:hypothetical protein [Pseudomonadota bacterium]
MQLRYGTRIEVGSGRLVKIVDRAGCIHAELTWQADGTLDRLVVAGAIVRGRVIDDPLLGPAHAIEPTGTTLSALAWARPTEIPTVADPARLPPGVGSAILNVIAHLARWADVPVLRYAGPYPTPALFHTLRRSFHTTATEAAFTADVLGRATRLARDPLPFELVPDPCERVAIPGGFVELRAGLERVVHHGVAYERGGGIARLVEAVDDDDAGADRLAAEIWFGDQRYARVAVFTDDGHVVQEPRPIPPCRSDVIGRAFPPPLRAALAELVAELVPAPLADDARAVLTARAITWADLAARAAVEVPTGFAVHAALWDRLAPHGLARVAQALAEALAPVVASTIVAELATRSRDLK